MPTRPSLARRSLPLTVCLALLTVPVPAIAGIDEVNTPAADFSLTERSGRTVTRDDLRGKVWVASFVLTRCPDGKCPQVSQTMRQLQDRFAARPDVVLVTFTVDPERDNPDELKRYADGFGADPERWLFLTGSEEQIDALQRSFYLRAKPHQKGEFEHSQQLIVVDRHGHMRGAYLGLRFTDPDPDAAEKVFQDDLRRLQRQVHKLLEPELPAYLPGDFPAFNALLNGVSAALIVLAYTAIRLRWLRVHGTLMMSAIVVSMLFLTSYLFYHLVVKQGQPTRFADQAPDAPAWVASLYLTILGSHTLLAVPTAPLVLYTAYQGLRYRVQPHVRVARWTYPLWLYVSVTGVVVYWMLYRLYPLS